MKTFTKTCAALCGIAFTLNAQSGEPSVVTAEPTASSNLWDAGRPDSHAPIGVMADHTHEAGEIMLSYRYMYMPMRSNYDGSSTVSDAAVLKDYMVVPTSMDMHMHMLGAMYAPTDEITLMFMAPYSFLSMDHLRRDGKRFTTESEGWGDLSLGGMFKVYDANRSRVHLNLSVGLPTGSIEEKDEIPGPGITQLPYPMQIGSGSWSIKPGITYLGQASRCSWGAQVMGDIYIDDNSQGYRLGNSVNASIWGAYKLTDSLSSSLRLAGRAWDDIDGADRDLVIPAGAVPTADPDLRGGKRVDVGLGLNYKLDGALSGNRLSIEALLPVYQDLDGPQLGSEWSLVAGWQFSF
jgi:hypothetical protein